MPRKRAAETQYAALAGSSRDRSGFWIVVIGEPGESKENVYTRAQDILKRLYSRDEQLNKIAEITNLNILTVPQVQRAFPRAWAHWEFMIDAGIPY